MRTQSGVCHGVVIFWHRWRERAELTTGLNCKKIPDFTRDDILPLLSHKIFYQESLWFHFKFTFIHGINGRIKLVICPCFPTYLSFSFHCHHYPFLLSYLYPNLSVSFTRFFGLSSITILWFFPDLVHERANFSLMPFLRTYLCFELSQKLL